jgi:uncharacterized membrane protein YfhO
VFGLAAEGPFCYDCPARAAAPGGPAQVRWHWAPGAIGIDVESPGGTYVVLGESLSRGWRATLDGRPVPIHQVSEMFQGVWVDAGRHALAWRFAEPGFFLGLAVMVVALGVTIALPRVWTGGSP